MPVIESKKYLRAVPDDPLTTDLMSPGELANKYQALFEQASDAIVTLLPTGEVDDSNLAFEELTGYLGSELKGHEITLIAPRREENRVPMRARPLSLEVMRTPGMYEDVAILRKDGYVRMVDLSVRQVESGGHALFLALFRDLTEKRQMERELITKHAELRSACAQMERANVELKSMQESLVQAGKMAALGELATGIAHELNQPLQSIRGYAQELEDVGGKRIGEGPRGEELLGFLKEIIASVDKMKSIIDYLRVFVRKSTEKHELVAIHEVIDEALKFLNRQFSVRGIEVHKDYEIDPPRVYANPVALEQVFINLATNARDAIEETGRGKGNFWIRTRSTNQFVEVSIKDDGRGMNERTKARAFNPFFTTKEVGKGMGLGLSLSYGILSKLHASIVVRSEIGKGAEFVVKIPRDYREVA